MKRDPKTYECFVMRALDGDTFNVTVNLGFYVQLIVTIRIYGINCEEMHDKDPEKKEMAKKAKTFAQGFAGKPGKITVISEDKYGRYVAQLEVEGKRYADEILSLNLAKLAIYTLADCES
jgi:micrococcal nuclease